MPSIFSLDHEARRVLWPLGLGRGGRVSQCLMIIIPRRSGQIDVEVITISAVLGLPVHCPSPFKTLASQLITLGRSGDRSVPSADWQVFFCWWPCTVLVRSGPYSTFNCLGHSSGPALLRNDHRKHSQRVQWGPDRGGTAGGVPGGWRRDGGSCPGSPGVDFKLPSPGQLQARQRIPQVRIEISTSTKPWAHSYRVFYRGCNYSSETFKRKYDLFYTVRSLMPAWFDDWNAWSEAVQRILEAGAILPLRGYDKQGRFVMIIRQRFADPAIMATDDLYKTFIMLFTIAMEQNYQVSPRITIYRFPVWPGYQTIINNSSN